MARKHTTIPPQTADPAQAPRYDDFLLSDLKPSPAKTADVPAAGSNTSTDPVRSDAAPADTAPSAKSAAQQLPDGARRIGEYDDDSFAAGDVQLEDPSDVTSAQQMAKLQAQMERAAEERKQEDGESMAERMRQRLQGNAVPTKPVKEKKHFFRRLVTVVISILLIGTVLSMIAANLFELAILKMPESSIARILTPVQSFFSSLTGGTADYFAALKRRTNLQAAYNDLLAQNERLAYQAMLADELTIQLSQYEDMYDEVNLNTNMNPIVCQVIGKSDGNYFTTFTINKGSRDGIENYMAVTLSGALVGYTENVQETSCTVRAIIDGEASIAGLIQSSRDQGAVRGAMNTDNTASCRMYYLSDDNLPRPGDMVVTSGVGLSFPKGIPIGTVRESTRGMDANKAYIVVDPIVDFKHIEYVIVLRYKPAAQAISDRSSASMEFVPLTPKRTNPPLKIGGSTWGGVTPQPNTTATPEPTPTPTPAPTATPRPTKTPEPISDLPVYEYQMLNQEPTPEPTDTPEPTPTPYYTPDPSLMTYEEED